MSLTKVEQKVLQLFAKVCEPKNECGAVLSGPCSESEWYHQNKGCEFTGCCLNCFLRGKIHRKENEREKVVCGKELHDYFDHNLILSDEWSLAGLPEEDVEKAVAMLKAIRGGMEPGLVFEEFLRK